MDKLNPKDFIFGTVPIPNEPIKNMYESSVKMSTKQKRRIRKIAEYRYNFYELSCTIDRYIDYGTQDYYHTTIKQLSNDDFNRHMYPLSFMFNCFLYDDIEETVHELEKFNKFVINHMKYMKKEAGGEALTEGIIRDSNGRDITQKALKVMEKALKVAYGKLCGLPNASIVAEIFNTNATDEQRKKAEDDIGRHKKNAAILIERVKMGTFPNDNNGEWKLA